MRPGTRSRPHDQQNAAGFSASTFSVQTAELSGIITFGIIGLSIFSKSVCHFCVVLSKTKTLCQCAHAYFLNASKSDQGSQFYEEPATSHVNCAEKVN